MEEADSSVRVEFNEFGGRGGHNAVGVVSVVSAGGRGRCTGTDPLDSCFVHGCMADICGYTHLVRVVRNNNNNSRCLCSSVPPFCVVPFTPNPKREAHGCSRRRDLRSQAEETATTPFVVATRADDRRVCPGRRIPPLLRSSEVRQEGGVSCSVRRRTRPDNSHQGRGAGHAVLHLRRRERSRPTGEGVAAHRGVRRRAVPRRPSAANG